jgi:hypothetical protein
MLATATSVNAAPTQRAAAYFGIRDKARLTTGVTPMEIQLRGKRYVDSVIEVKGAILGHARRPGGGTLMLRTNEGEYLIEAPETIPESQLETGQNVRVLCKVLAIEGSEQAELLALAVVGEYDAIQVDIDRQVRADQERAKQLRSNQRPQMASRGHIAVTRRGPTTTSKVRPEILTAYRDAVLYFNKRLSAQQAERIAANIIVYSNRYDLDARLVMAVVACESNFNANAVSRTGAMGLGQLMPGTAAGLGVGDAFDPESNLEGSTRLLSGHISNMAKKSGQITEKEIKLALACYNAGAGAVKKHGGIPPYRETRNYVKKVTQLYYRLCGGESG